MCRLYHQTIWESGKDGHSSMQDAQNSTKYLRWLKSETLLSIVKVRCRWLWKYKLNRVNALCSFLCIISTHHVADVCKKELQEILQSAHVQAGIFLSVWALGLAPSHRFPQPELHLLDAQQRLCPLLGLDQRLGLRHGAGPGEFTQELKEILDESNAVVKPKDYPGKCSIWQILLLWRLPHYFVL